MTNRKWSQLVIVLIIASILLIGATQRFDTIIAKKIIVTSSGGLVLGTNSGSFDLNGKQMIIDDDADSTLAATTDDQVVVTLGAATGYLNVDTGNLKVGDGTPTFTQSGEDAYIEGAVELASDFIIAPQTIFTVTSGIEITPTGLYQIIGSGDLAQTVNDIATPTDNTTGKQLILHNMNATFPITIDGTGATVECKADVELGPKDTLTLIWNGTDWNCLSNYDNS